MTLTAETFDFVATLVRQRSAIQLERGKEYLVESRLAPLARSAGAAGRRRVRSRHARGHHEARHRGRGAHDERDLVVSRSQPVHRVAFDCGARPASPGASSSMRIWSAACSTGQEAYSIAMILADNFPSVRASIVATDLADHVLAKGRSGRYTQLEINRGLPAPMLVKHFERQGPSFEISSQLRSQVVFRKHNLLDQPARWWTVRHRVLAQCPHLLRRGHQARRLAEDSRLARAGRLPVLGGRRDHYRR